MNQNKAVVHHHNRTSGFRKKYAQIFLIAWTLFTIVIASAPFCWSATTTKTLFLPLKIHAETEIETLAEAVDKAISDSLSRQDELIFMARSSAVAKLNYHGTWPPALDEIEKIATTAGVDYVACGSLSKVGGTISIDISVFDLLDSFALGKVLPAEKPFGDIGGQKRIISPVYFFRHAESTDNLPQIIEKIVDDIKRFTHRKYNIAKISITGNKRIDTGAIMRNIKSKADDKYNKAALRQDLKNIFQMGYFDDVQIKTSDTDKGKEVVFEVKEKAVVGKILFSGLDKLKEDEIKEVITVRQSSILNTKEVKTSAANIRKLYKEKGFYNAQVTPDITFQGKKKDIVQVKFIIDEGKKIFIKKIKFSGNNSFKRRKLKKFVSTTEKGFFSWLTDSGRLKQDLLDQDADRIAAFYHNEGFIDATVGKPEIVQEGKWLYITFNIKEGERYTVGEVDITGDLIDPKEELVKLLQITEEKQYFSRDVLRQDMLTLSDHYAEDGYAFADIMPLTKTDTENLKVNLDFRIDKGSLVHVNRILIKGNTTTRDKVIRREIALDEGGLFKTSSLRKSVQRLNRLEYFEEVNVIPEPALGENLMDINVEVKEKRTGTFSIGAGYSSVDQLMFNAQVTKDNLFGRGQKLSFSADLSANTTRFNLNFTDPYLNDSKLLAGIDLYNQERNYTDYTRDSEGFKFRFGYPIWEKWKLFWSYGYDHTILEDVAENASFAIQDSEDINYTSSVTLGLSRDTRDRRYAASEGSVNSINLEYAGGPLGGDSGYTKIEGSTSWFFPLFWDTVFHPKIAAGYVMENRDGRLPIFEKFFLGGLRTIRGYEFGTISPKDPVTGERIGGEKMWYANIEYIFPIKKDMGLRGVLFFDVGNVYAAGEAWDMYDNKRSVGAGFRWLSPIGPLRLEWGYNLDREEDEDPSNFDFSIGGAF